MSWASYVKKALDKDKLLIEGLGEVLVVNICGSYSTTSGKMIDSPDTPVLDHTGAAHDSSPRHVKAQRALAIAGVRSGEQRHK